MILAFSAVSLSACSEAIYGAHLVKQIPSPSDTPKSQGTFKVGTPYKIEGKKYIPQESYSHVETGIASWYGPGFHGKRTANGEVFNKHELTAAHRTLQMPSLVRVTNLNNGRSLVLRVNDRGPYAHNRVLDVSERAAEQLGFKNHGTAKVKLQVLGPESRQIAQAAKSGKDTRGYEVAINQNRIPGASPTASSPVPAPKPAAAPAAPQPVLVAQSQGQPPAASIPSYKQFPAQPANIYVQAGAFSVENNALALARKLEGVGPSKVYLTHVNSRPFYKVRVGPFADHASADVALNSVLASGTHDAHFVIDRR